MHKVLTIAGSDSSAGAGIQADLRTFQAFGVYGASALTAVTAQNAKEVRGIITLPAKFVALQIDAVMQDGGVDVWKTGMLANADIIKTVVQKAKQYKVKILIVDPVLTSSSGRRILEKRAESVLVKRLFPLATVVTPNIPEAEALAHMQIKTAEDMKKAAILLHKIGAKNVVVKGGHLPLATMQQFNNATIDILHDGKKFYEFRGPYIKTSNTHGTGCTFASAIAAELAKGITVYEAVKTAKAYVVELIKKRAGLRP